MDSTNSQMVCAKVVLQCHLLDLVLAKGMEDFSTIDPALLQHYTMENAIVQGTENLSLEHQLQNMMMPL
jgi:hypothetical protein